MLDYTVEVDNTTLQIYERGLPSDQLIIFLHGGPGSGASPIMKHPTFQALENHYRCIYFDQRGSGASIYPIENGLVRQRLIQDVHAVIEDSNTRWKPKSIFLWGGSYGGFLACLYVQQYPDTIQGLLLSSPALCYDRHQTYAFYQQIVANMKKRIHKENLSLLLSYCNLEPENFFQEPVIHSLIFSKQNPSTSLKHIAAMSSWFFQTYFHGFFKTLTIPTLILMGKEDPICSVNETIHEVKDSQYSYIQSICFSPCGHAVFDDCKKDFILSITSFLSKI